MGWHATCHPKRLADGLPTHLPTRKRHLGAMRADFRASWQGWHKWQALYKGSTAVPPVKHYQHTAIFASLSRLHYPSPMSQKRSHHSQRWDPGYGLREALDAIDPEGALSPEARVVMRIATAYQHGDLGALAEEVSRGLRTVEELYRLPARSLFDTTAPAFLALTRGGHPGERIPSSSEVSSVRTN